MNFGSDGFEREAKALKRQLNEKGPSGLPLPSTCRERDASC